MPDLDTLVVGAGPNGLAASIVMARAGRSVLLVEAQEDVGGAARSAPLTLRGFTHDIGAAILPLALGSPFLRSLPLTEHGLRWIYPPAAAAHPLDGQPAVILYPSLARTAAGLGHDNVRYQRLVAPLAAGWEMLAPTVLGPLRPPRHPGIAARFALFGLPSASLLAHRWFRGERARALLAGMAAHAGVPLTAPLTAAYALLFLALAHTVGWPFPAGGTGTLTAALASYLRSLGGEIRTGTPVVHLPDAPTARSTLLDLTPRQVLPLIGDRLPSGYRQRLQAYRYGPGVFKIDYALSGPIPWEDAEVARAGTVHLGGTFDEIANAEAEVARGLHPQRPFVLLAQQSLFDRSRAPEGKHTAWAYCHVPNGSNEDMTDRIEAQIERFAPGFHQRILARHILRPADLERLDANLVGGDSAAGAADALQILFRPTISLSPYTLPLPGLYLCSASTPPGPGVHGMCGYHAARAALRASGADVA